MRIAFYGNTCNNFFAIARAVRRASDIDAHLFIDSDADWMQFPESENPELRNNYPDWIHKGPYHSMAARFWPGRSPLVKELNGFDVMLRAGAPDIIRSELSTLRRVCKALIKEKT